MFFFGVMTGLAIQTVNHFLDEIRDRKSGDFLVDDALSFREEETK